MTSVQLTTSDGHNLAADIAVPTGTADSADTLGGVVLCHPHPSYGGNRFNTVVEALFHSLPAAGFVTLRFDFRAEHGPFSSVDDLDAVPGIGPTRIEQLRDLVTP